MVRMKNRELKGIGRGGGTFLPRVTLPPRVRADM